VQDFRAMISSLNNHTLSDARDRNAAIHRVFTSSLVETTPVNDAGLRSFIDHIFSLIGTGSTDSATRASGYMLLDNILNSNSSKNEKILSDGRMIAFIDRLPILFETIQPTEIESFLILFHNLLQQQQDILTTTLTRALPKLIARITRILRSSSNSSSSSSSNSNGSESNNGGGGVLDVRQHTMLCGLRLINIIIRSSNSKYSNLLLSSMN
jgi:hypothetical protein